MTKAITKTDIKNFNNDGVVVLRGVFKDWIEVLIRGAEFHINNPSESALIHKQDSYQGQFMEDFCNWQRIAEYKDFVLNSPLGSFAADLTESKSIQFFHDHFFIKRQALVLLLPGIKICLIIVFRVFKPLVFGCHLNQENKVSH